MKTKYVIKIVSIIYAIVETWINIPFAILMISHFAKNLKPDHFSIVSNQILRYLANSLEKSITLEKNPNLSLLDILTLTE